MDRVTSGIAELDRILDGGFPRHSLNIIAGAPGTGKTVLAQQLAFANARPEAPALYLTTLSEPRSEILRYLQRFAFFDDAKLLGQPPAIVYRDITELLRDAGIAALPKTLRALLAEHQPAYLIIDSFKALRELGHTSELRRVMFDLAADLAARACTTVLVGEYTPTEIEELPEFAIADGILHLVNRAYGTRDERYLRVRKLRGSGYRAGEHAFKVTPAGLAVFPRLVTPDQPISHVTSLERISTGVTGLDAMVDGGLRRGSSTLVAGAAGTGKTLLGVHFLFAGISAGEHGLLVSFQENPSLLRHLFRGLGLDASQLDEGGRLTSLYMSPVEMNIDEVVRRIVDVLDTRPIRRIVIDSLGDLEGASTDPLRFRSYIYSLAQLFAVRGITSYATMESLVDPSVSAFTRVGVSYISDNVFALRFHAEGDLRPDSTIERLFSVVKCRGSAHDVHVRRMMIGPRGVQIGGPAPR